MLSSSLTVSRLPVDNLTPEERDARTVFCMQLAARIRPRDLEDFFSAVGKVTSDPWPFHFLLLAQALDSVPCVCVCFGMATGAGREDDLRQELPTLQRHRLYRVCGSSVGTAGHRADGAKAAGSSHHRASLAGTWQADRQMVNQSDRPPCVTVCVTVCPGREKPGCSSSSRRQ